MDELVRIALVLVVAVAVMLLAGCGLQRRVLFPRHLVTADPNAGPPADGRRLWIESDQGRVEAWLLPGRDATADTPGPAVIFAHGNGELIDHWPDELAPYRDMGVTVMLCEFRGYGRSAGKPTEKRINADFAQFCALLSEQPFVDAQRLIYHGRSLGSGAVTALAKQHPPAALILESAFISVPAMARKMGFPGCLVADKFDNQAALESVNVPVLIMHGRNDSIIPFAHAQALDQAATDSQLIAYDCGHNDLPPRGQYWRDIKAFLVAHRIVAD